jgi:uridylate kinase
MYKRVLLKVSGELLGGDHGGFDYAKINDLAKTILEFKKTNDLELAIVVGGGNVWRFSDNSELNLPRVVSDRLGMTATIMNGVLLKEALVANGDDARVASALEVENLVDRVKTSDVVDYLEFGETVVFAGGTGNPFYTTDSCAVLRALETECDFLLKATKVPGVFDKDPKKFPDAKKYNLIDHQTAIVDELRVMDLTAMSMARDAKLKIMVFDFSKPVNLLNVFTDSALSTIVETK